MPFIRYDFHPLFRRFMQNRAESMLSHERCDHLRRETAKLLADVGETEAAVDLLRAAGAWEALSKLIVAQAPELMASARLPTLASWIQSLVHRRQRGFKVLRRSINASFHRTRPRRQVVQPFHTTAPITTI